MSTSNDSARPSADEGTENARPSADTSTGVHEPDQDAGKPLASVIMGSQSDWETMRHAAEML